MRLPVPLSTLFIAFLSAAPAPSALAQNAKLKQAEAALTDLERGDGAALDDARAAINLAASHTKTREQALTWVLRGHIYLQHVLDPNRGGTSADPTEEVLNAFTRAGELGLEDPEARRVVIADLRVLQSATRNEVFDRVERKKWDEAYALLGPALRARDLLISMNEADSRRDAELLRLAILITTHHGRLDEAKTHHRSFTKAGEFDPTITAQLAEQLSRSESVDTALLFLRKARQDHPDDPTLLAKEIELLLAAERAEAAVIALDAAAAELGDGIGADLLLARLYEKAGADEAAGAAYDRVLARNPEHVEALVPAARLALRAISALEGQLEGDTLNAAERAALETARKDRYLSAVAHLETAALEKPDSVEIFQMLHRSYEGMGDATRAKTVSETLLKLAPNTEQTGADTPR